MSNAKLIHDYLDGELDETRKEALFSEIAASQEMRMEFDQQVKLHTIAQADMNSITPPVEVTSSVFAGLGFRIPSGNYLNRVSGGSAGFMAKAGELIRRYSPLVLTAILASLTTFFIMNTGGFQGSVNSNDISSASGNSAKSNIPIVSSYENRENLKAENNDFENNSADNSYAASANNSARYSSNHSNDNLNSGSFVRTSRATAFNSFDDSQSTGNVDLLAQNDEDALENSTGLFSTSGSEYSGYMKNNEYYDKYYGRVNNVRTEVSDLNHLKVSSTIPLAEDPEYLQLGPKIDNTKWALEYRRNQLLGSNSFGLKEKEDPALTNFAVVVTYKVNPYEAFSFGAGRQQFPMEFNLIEKGKSITQIQNPALAWIGASYRYSFKDASFAPHVIYPFTKVFTGITTVGPILSGQAGLEYRLGWVGLYLALESNNLFYQVGSNIYTSDKIGITYGINVNF